MFQSLLAWRLQTVLRRGGKSDFRNTVPSFSQVVFFAVRHAAVHYFSRKQETDCICIYSLAEADRYNLK